MPRQPNNRKFLAETSLWPWPAFRVGALLLLAGSFFYVWLRVEPVLGYNSYGPYFYRQKAFLESFLSRPGGLAEYGGVFLSQMNCLSWLGAVIFVLSECAVLLGAFACLERIGGEAARVAALVPVFVLLVLRNQWGCPVAALSVGLVLALGGAAIHIWIPWRRAWLSTAASGLVSIMLFFLAGLWSAVLYAGLCSWFGIARLRSWPAGAGCLLLALAAPMAAVGPGHLEVAKLLKPWPEGANWVQAACLYGCVPVAGVILVLLPKGRANPEGIGRPVWAMALTILAGWIVVWLTFDERRKLLAEMDYNTSRGQYEEVLAAARQVKEMNHPAKVRLHLALYHTGRLAEELFSFHNMINDEPMKGVGEDWRAQSQPLFELGLISDAEHMAHDALAIEGERPDLLRLLARINVLKDRPKAAQVFLNVLSRIPFEGERGNDGWPGTVLQMPATEVAALAGLRTRMLTNEVPHDGLPTGLLLNVLLASNPTNRMAFEYLMAQYLMELDLKKAVERLRFLDYFNYRGIPRPYEEAVLLYQLIEGVQVELRGRAIRPETVERFRQFRESADRLDESVEARAAMAARFGDTYWYYFAARSRQQVAESQASAP